MKHHMRMKTKPGILGEQPIARADRLAKAQRLAQPRPTLPSPQQSASYDDDGGVIRPKKLILQMIIEDRDVSLAEIEAALRKTGMNVTRVTVGNIRRDVRELLRVLDEMGMLRTRPVSRA